MRIGVVGGRGWLLGSMMLVASTAFAQTGETEPPPETPQAAVWAPSPTWTIELFPAGDLYPAYVADPHRPTNELSIGFGSSPIPDSRSPRIHLSAGGRFGMMKFGPNRPDARRWQVSLDAGLDAVFDSHYKNDAIGWDGNYGLTVTSASPASRLGLKMAFLHSSAHLGDEYQDRTNAERLGYTREEFALGASWRLRPMARIYGELGIAYLLGSEEQQRWRWQMGAEYQARPSVFGNRMSWYGAADFSALQERGRLDSTLQGGLVTGVEQRTYRIFLQLLNGRPTLGEFTFYTETSFSIGLRIDL